MRRGIGIAAAALVLAGCGGPMRPEELARSVDTLSSAAAEGQLLAGTWPGTAPRRHSHATRPRAGRRRRPRGREARTRPRARGSGTRSPGRGRPCGRDRRRRWAGSGSRRATEPPGRSRRVSSRSSPGARSAWRRACEGHPPDRAGSDRRDRWVRRHRRSRLQRAGRRDARLQRFWAVPVGVLGIIVFAEMSGRIVASRRNRTSSSYASVTAHWLSTVTLVASLVLTVLTLAAELGGLGFLLNYFFDVSVSFFVLVGPGRRRRRSLLPSLRRHRAHLRLHRAGARRLSGRLDQARPAVVPGRERLRSRGA